MHFFMVRVSIHLLKSRLGHSRTRFKNSKIKKNSIHKFKIPKWLILDTVNMHSENEMIYKCKFRESLKPQTIRALRSGGTDGLRVLEKEVK